MQHTYAALLLNEANEELNERNLTAVLEAAGCPVSESRTKAFVAALEGVDVDDVAAEADVPGGGKAEGDEGGAETPPSADGDLAAAGGDAPSGDPTNGE